MLKDTNLIVRLSDLAYRTVPQVIAENPLAGLVVPYQLHDGYAWALETFPPAHDPATHCAVLDTPLQNDAGDWVQSWRIEALTAEQLAERAAALALAREAALASVTVWRNAQEGSGFVFEHDGRRWDGGKAVRDRLQPMLDLPALPPGFFWTDADDNDVDVTLDELADLYVAHQVALITKGFEIHVRQRELKAGIDAMGADALQAFVPGWADA